MLIIRPSLLSLICGKTAFATLTIPNKFVSNVIFQSSMDNTSALLKKLMPALLISISIPRSLIFFASVSISLIAFSTESSEVTSKLKNLILSINSSKFFSIFLGIRFFVGLTMVFSLFVNFHFV